MNSTSNFEVARHSHPGHVGHEAPSPAAGTKASASTGYHQRRLGRSTFLQLVFVRSQKMPSSFTRSILAAGSAAVLLGLAGCASSSGYPASTSAGPVPC